jgi:hypothetical protein
MRDRTHSWAVATLGIPPCTFIALLFLGLVAGCPQCGNYDYDGVAQKLIDCQVRPSVMPECAIHDDGTRRHALREFAERAIDSKAEEECVLGASCDTQALADCLGKDNPERSTEVKECRRGCGDEIQVCGGGDKCKKDDPQRCDECDIPTVDRCFQQYDFCVGTCGATNGAVPH